MISNALNTQGSGGNPFSYTPANTNPSIYNYGQSTPKLPTPTPSTPLQSVTTPDGTSYTYHKPTTPTGTTAGTLNTSATGTNPGFIGDNGVSKSYAQGVADSSITQPQPTQNQQAVSGLIGYGTGTNNNPTVTGAISGLLNNGQQAADLATNYGQQYNTIGQQGANSMSGFGDTSPVVFGNGALIAQNQAAKQQALAQGNTMELAGLSQQASNLNSAGSLGSTQQSQNIGALQNAGSLTQPVAGASYFGSPTTGGLVGQGGQLMANAVQQATQLVQNGTSPTDPSVTSLLAPFGAPAQQAFTAAMQQNSGGSYNPTVQAATSQQNASQAVNYQQQATNLDTGLKNLTVASNLANNFLNSENLLNPTDNPNVNASINSYIGTFKNPADVQSYKLVLNDIAKFQSQILSSDNGLTPTAQTQAIASVDPSTLSAPQLKDYFQTLTELGNNQLAILQGQQSGSANAGSSAYTGTPTTTNTTPNLAPNASSDPGLNNKLAEATVGTAQGFLGDIGNIVSGIFSKVFSY